MQHFPVSNSNLSASALATWLQHQYQLSGTIQCRIIKAGINDTYLVDTGSHKYVFRVYSLHWRTRAEIEAELQLLLFLQENQLSVSYPIADPQQQYLQVLPAPEGDRYGVLFSYADGEKLHQYADEVHYQIGVLMARFHQLTHHRTLNRVTYTPQLLLVDSLEKIGQFLSAGTEEMHFMQAAQQYLLATLNQADTAAIRHGGVHLDIWYDNLNINTAHQVTLFDFDFCGNGWLCIDIAYYLLQLSNMIRDEATFQVKQACFLEGYTSITSISEEEKRLLPALGVSVYFFYLGVQCARYDNWSNSFLSESYLKRFINQLVKRYYDLHQLGTPS
ncbi:phosphotransferase [Chitinophaga nivalis]|uniref:Phosphotransferase n=1 Tax=Chitinophaga nivalis TaxID=2991709 RepID=A0ABT3IKP2_9BACT|nr:phosphotransferase [Chitinophaga nivalis]MCW3465759.1 phosphotransferase [Chitinophaga nivalis]MCW3484550.1 phosphotransferase [Chitinophaga nivalis]